MRALPEHARNQIRNELAGQQNDGLVPGVINFDASGKASWKDFKGFPPIWPVAVDAYVEATGDVDFLKECLAALRKQIGWFESNAAVTGGGFYYLDILPGHVGKRHGRGHPLRPASARRRPPASMPARTSIWSTIMPPAGAGSSGSRTPTWEEKAKALQQFIQKELWDRRERLLL